MFNWSYPVGLPHAPTPLLVRPSMNGLPPMHNALLLPASCVYKAPVQFSLNGFNSAFVKIISSVPLLCHYISRADIIIHLHFSACLYTKITHSDNMQKWPPNVGTIFKGIHSCTSNAPNRPCSSFPQNVNESKDPGRMVCGTTQLVWPLWMELQSESNNSTISMCV